MRANGAPSCTRLEVSLRTSQKHLANNSAVLTKTQLLDKVSIQLPITNGALETGRAFGVTPMRALPAKYNLALPASRLQVGDPSPAKCNLALQKKIKTHWPERTNRTW